MHYRINGRGPEEASALFTFMRAGLQTNYNEEGQAESYCVIDTQYNTLIIFTKNRRLAEKCLHVVDKCKHNGPYDLIWHIESTDAWS